MKYLILLIAFNISQAKVLGEGLKAINVKIKDFDNVETQKMFSRDTGKTKFLNANFKKDDAIYDIEVISPMELDKFNATKYNLTTILISSYGDQSTPYSGAITNTAKCDSFFTPVVTKKNVKGSDISIIKAYVGERYNFGICSKNMIAYESCSTFYYLKGIAGFLKLKIMTKDQKARCIHLSESFINSIE